MSSHGNGFGRRPPIRDNLPPRAATGPAAPAALAATVLIKIITSRGVLQIGGVLIGVAIALASVTEYVRAMKSAGKALDRHWADHAGYPTLDQPPSARPNAPSTYNELRTTCLATAKKANLSRAMRADLDYFVNIRVGEEQLEQHAAFIDCLITSHPGRLCQAEHRAHLADAVSSYFRLRMRVREEWIMARGPFSAPARGLVARPGQNGISTQYPSERTDPRIVDGLRSLIEQGLLTAADLGAGLIGRMPSDLAQQLKSVERKKATCG
jgi:hypothetical protein